MFCFQVDDELADIDLNDPDLNKAATKIQASFRGHKVRKEVTPKDGENGEEMATGQWAVAMSHSRHVTSRRSTDAMPEPAEVMLSRSIAFQCWCQNIPVVTVIIFLFIYYIKFTEKNIYIRKVSARKWMVHRQCFMNLV